MSIIACIVLGLIAGFSGSKLVNKTGEGYSMKPPPVTTPQPADPLWRRAVRYLRLTRRGRQ
jgi:hypothetical protein